MEWMFWILLLMPTAGLLWMMWLYVLTFRRVIQLERDNYRLMRRLGQYHSIALTTPSDSLPQPSPEAAVPPAFRARRPTPQMSVTDQQRAAQAPATKR